MFTDPESTKPPKKSHHTKRFHRPVTKLAERSALSLLLAIVIATLAFSLQSSAQSSRTYSYLALGDSYTIGEGVDAKRRWPVQLANFLNIKGKKVAPPIIIAKKGWRTDELYEAVSSDKRVESEKFDLVSLLIGMNDQYQGKDIKNFPAAFEKLLEFAIDVGKRGKKSVFVLSIPDYGATPFGKDNAEKIAKEIDAYNAICEDLCKRRKIPFYTITEISRRATAETDLVASDRLHPSGEMYRLWVAKIVDQVKKSLPKR